MYAIRSYYDLVRLPLAAAACDMVLCECIWNLTAKERVLAEFARVLKADGILAITDIYARGLHGDQAGRWPVRCCFSQATDLETVKNQVTAAGFV